MRVIIVGNNEDYEKACNLIRSRPDFKNVELVHESTNIVCDIETFKDTIITNMESKERGIILVGSNFSMTNSTVSKHDGSGVINIVKYSDEDVEQRYDTIRNLSKPTTNMLSIPVVHYNDFESGKERRRKRRKFNRKH